MDKIDLYVALVKEHLDNGFHVAVFVNFVPSIEALQQKLNTDCIIVGGQRDDVRQNNKNNFQSDQCKVILLNSESGGTSISLHDLHGNYPRCAIISPTDNAKTLIQVMGRIHRAEAKSEAINYLVCAEDTIEERVYDNVNSKMNDIQTLNDGDLAEDEVFND